MFLASVINPCVDAWSEAAVPVLVLLARNELCLKNRA